MNNSKKINYTVCDQPDKPLIYVLRGESGDMLIDTGGEDTKEHLDAWLTKCGFNIKWIFLTHGHYDHAFNAAYFQEKYNAEIIIHKLDKDLLLGKVFEKVIAFEDKNKDFANEANDLLKEFKTPKCEVSICLEDGDVDYLKKLGFDAQVVMLPGHTSGSMGIKQDRVLYCGDACSAVRGDYKTAIIGSDIENVIRSEKKIFELNPLVIAPGHGKLIINELAFPKSEE